MKNAEMTYGALSAKIRALYGKRLRADDFARLAGLKNALPVSTALPSVRRGRFPLTGSILPIRRR